MLRRNFAFVSGHPLRQFGMFLGPSFITPASIQVACAKLRTTDRSAIQAGQRSILAIADAGTALLLAMSANDDGPARLQHAS